MLMLDNMVCSLSECLFISLHFPPSLFRLSPSLDSLSDGEEKPQHRTWVSGLRSVSRGPAGDESCKFHNRLNSLA